MASVPFSFECTKEGGFVMDPNQHQRVGYIVSLAGFGLTGQVAKDLTVAVPFNANQAPSYTGITLVPGKTMKTATVVGVIEKFEWNGGTGDPIKFESYVSQTNAFQIKALQQQTLRTSAVNSLGWWICDYDQAAKTWFEQSFPKTGLITGMITGKDNPELDVDLNPVVVKDGIDVNVYKISMGIVPGANKSYALQFANSASKPLIKSWGLVVGGMAATAIG